MHSSSILSLLTLGLSVAALSTDDYDYLFPFITEEQMADHGLILEVLPLAGLTLVNSTSKLRRRQDIDFALADSMPDPANTTSSAYNQASALAAVVADINSDPLVQKRNSAVNKRAISGYTDSISLGNAALNAPLNCNGADTYMGSKLWNDNIFDEARCATACTAQSAYNLKHPPSKGSPKTCQFYNTYVLYKNEVSQGQYCSLYTQQWDASKATNKGQYRGSDHYTIQQSIVATNVTNSGDVSCPSDVSYMIASGQDFCTSYLGYIAPTATFTATTTPATSVVTSVQTDKTTQTVYSTISQQTTVATTLLTINAKKRALQTPASVSSWSPSRISAACGSVVTGSTSTTTTIAAATPLSTFLSTTLQTVLITSVTTEVVPVIATSTTSSAPKASIIINGGFESGAKTGGDNPGWTQVRSHVVVGTTLGHSGNSYEWMETSPGKLCSISQTLYNLNTTTSNGVLSFWYSRVGRAGTCDFTITLGTTTIAVEHSVTTATIGRPDWSLKSYGFITPPASTADLTFSITCSAVGSQYVIDDVAFSQST